MDLSIKLTNENILKLIFQEVNHGKLLIAEFDLKSKDIQLNEKLEIFYKKIKYLSEENEEKNKKLKTN